MKGEWTFKINLELKYGRGATAAADPDRDAWGLASYQAEARNMKGPSTSSISAASDKLACQDWARGSNESQEGVCSKSDITIIIKKKKENKQTVEIESGEIIIHTRFIFGRRRDTFKDKLDGERWIIILKIYTSWFINHEHWNISRILSLPWRHLIQDTKTSGEDDIFNQGSWSRIFFCKSNWCERNIKAYQRDNR